MEYEKIVLVTRKTRLEGLVERFNTRGQARFYLEHSGGNFDLYEREHETYYAAVRGLRDGLQTQAKLQVIERGFLPNFLFAEGDVVVTIGIDGLVVNTAKYLHGQPLVAVNPDPAHIDGVLLPFNVQQAPHAVAKALRGGAKVRSVSMAEATLNDGQRLLAFNDLFIGVRSHVSARYQIEAGGQQERQSSSGIIVSTGAGATGWLSSLFNMANGLWAGFASQPTRLEQPRLEQRRLEQPRLEWDAERLLFVVREPFTSKTSSARIVCGEITPQSPLILHSEMPDSGVIFSDGVETDFLGFNAGMVARIGLAERKTQLVVGD